MKKICTIGGATQDIFIEYEDAQTMRLRKEYESHTYLLFEQGLKIEVPHLYQSVGGGATNSACSFARLGFDVEAFFACGDDAERDFIEHQLRREGIGFSHRVVKKGFRSAVSFILPSPEKNNIAFCYRGATKELREEDFTDAFFQGASLVYITSLSGGSRALLPFLVKKAQSFKSAVVSNPGMRQIKESIELIEALSGIDILIVNHKEALHLMKRFLGKGDIPFSQKELRCEGRAPFLFRHFASFEGIEVSLCDYFSELFKRGPSIGVITNGAEGVYVGTPEGIYFHPSLGIEPVSSLGAGDAFGSTFAGALALGKTLEEALVYGVVNASSVIQHRDTQSGLLTDEELQTKLLELGCRSIQYFKLF